MIKAIKTVGIDRNLKNLTFGNCRRVIQYDLSQAVEITENTQSVMRSFKRNDHRIRKKLSAKYGKRRRNRINQLLHRVSKNVIQQAMANKEAIVFENILYIRRLYQKGNGQSRLHRGMMNSWPFHEMKRQIEYKAKWSGIPIIQLSNKDTRGTSQLCPRCGKRTQAAERDDKLHHRQLWCAECQRWQDRDVIAAMNISLKGLLRFGSPQGAASEAMVQELGSKEPVILRVDAAKLSRMSDNRTPYIYGIFSIM